MYDKGDKKNENENNEKQMTSSNTTTDTSASLRELSRSSRRIISIIGIISLLCTVFLWVSGNYLVKEVVSKNFENPFLIVYFTQLSYMFYFIFLRVNDPLLKYISYLRQRIIVEDEVHHNEQGDDAVVSVDGDGDGEDLVSPTTTTNTNTKDDPEADASLLTLPPITTRQLCRISAIFTILYLLSNWSFSKSLVYTSVTTASILATTGAFTTLVIGIPLGVEYISGLRVLSCVVCLFAVVLVLLSNGSSYIGWLGNLMAIGSSVLNGIYSIYLRKASVNESRLNIPLIFAISGVYTLFAGLIPFYCLHVTGFESVPALTEWPVKYILVNVFVCGLLPNYLWNIAFICNSPFTVAVGTSFSLPLTFVIEYFLQQKYTHSLTEYFAAILMVVSCLLVNLSQLYPDWDVIVEGFLVGRGIVHKGFFGVDSDVPTDVRLERLLRRAIDRELSRK